MSADPLRQAHRARWATIRSWRRPTLLSRSLPGLLLVVVVAAVAACGHQTPIGASPKTPVPSPSNAADVGRLLVEALGDTRYVSAEAYLAPSLQSMWPDTALKSKWDSLATRYGKFTGVGGLTSLPAGADTDVSVQATFAGGVATVQLTVDPSLRVTRLDIPSGGVQAPPSGSQPGLPASSSAGASP